MCQAPSYGFAVPFFLPERAQAFYLMQKQQEFITVKLCQL
ncbi:hypothetical protein J576_1607 [Acinetobacter sp. 766875]|nr:hypothetical protein J576_1607 [Acinetobacter sp. 766875]